jgi:hypothetical protein
MRLFNCKEAQFWSWFDRNRLILADRNHPEFKPKLDELLDQLHGYCPHLYFEIGGHPEDSQRELIINAQGRKEYFATAEKLIQSAPKFENWTLIALTPPKDREFISRHEDGVEIDTREVWFKPLENKENPEKLGFRFFVKDFNEDKKDTYYYAMYIILDSILGERSAAEDVDFSTSKRFLRT